MIEKHAARFTALQPLKKPCNYKVVIQPARQNASFFCYSR